MGRASYLLMSLAVGLITTNTIFAEEEVVETLSNATCNFAVDLLKAVANEEEGDNVLMSPISIGISLSILEQGARGGTSEELQNVLHVTPETAKEAYTGVISRLMDDKNNVTFEWGNGIYLKPGFHLEEEFKNTVLKKFRSNIEEIDFIEPSTAIKINKWISEVTHGQINNLIDPSAFTNETVMVLVNAIYFKGMWNSPFERARTTSDLFEAAKENTTTTSFMRKDERFPAGEDPALGVKWLELPYKDDQFSMIFVLPNEKHGLKEVIDKLTGEDLRRMIENTDTRYVFMRIPKFKLSKKSSLESVLMELGLTSIFGSDANLEGISTTDKELRVSELVHQANVEVDEDGTTAAAATYVSVQVLSLITYADGMTFNANHPFLFFIIDKKSKIPLFVGRVSNPKQD